MADQKGNVSDALERSEKPATSGVAPDFGKTEKKEPEPGRNPANLSPEEQMALYEADLKENDWGHQPC